MLLRINFFIEQKCEKNVLRVHNIWFRISASSDTTLLRATSSPAFKWKVSESHIFLIWLGILNSIDGASFSVPRISTRQISRFLKKTFWLFLLFSRGLHSFFLYYPKHLLPILITLQSTTRKTKIKLQSTVNNIKYD